MIAPKWTPVKPYCTDISMLVFMYQNVGTILESYDSNRAAQGKAAKCEDLADFNDDKSEEEQLHFSSTNCSSFSLRSP